MLALTLVAFSLAMGAPGQVRGRYRSAALEGTLPFAVYLPPGYATSEAAATSRPTNPTGTQVLPHTPSQNAHVLVPQFRADERRRPTFFAFYVGSGDRRFRAENEQLDRELRAAGVPHVFRVYPGAHQQSVWESHARQWLALALGHLATSTRQ